MACFKEETDVVVLLKARWVEGGEKEKKITAMMQRRGLGDLCRVGEAKLISITCSSRKDPKQCLFCGCFFSSPSLYCDLKIAS